MAEHEPSICATSDWYTPPEYFKALGLVFDLDPCSPGPGHWVPAKKIYTKEDDGLRQPWLPGWLVFMNPPFGGRNSHAPSVIEFLNHRNSRGLGEAYNTAGWYHQNVGARAHSCLCKSSETKVHQQSRAM